MTNTKPTFEERAQTTAIAYAKSVIQRPCKESGAIFSAHLDGLRQGRKLGWEEAIQQIRDVDGLEFLDNESDFSWALFMEWLESRMPK